MLNVLLMRLVPKTEKQNIQIKFKYRGIYGFGLFHTKGKLGLIFDGIKQEQHT